MLPRSLGFLYSPCLRGVRDGSLCAHREWLGGRPQQPRAGGGPQVSEGAPLQGGLEGNPLEGQRKEVDQVSEHC